MRLENRIAVVTGGGQGIGRGIARLFAREGARLIAVNADPSIAGATQTERLVNETCDRMDMAGNTNATVEFTRTGDIVGDGATVTVSTPHDDLTGFVGAFGSITLSSTVEIRIEQTPGRLRPCRRHVNDATVPAQPGMPSSAGERGSPGAPLGNALRPAGGPANVKR